MIIVSTLYRLKCDTPNEVDFSFEAGVIMWQRVIRVVQRPTAQCLPYKFSSQRMQFNANTLFCQFIYFLTRPCPITSLFVFWLSCPGFDLLFGDDECSMAVVVIFCNLHFHSIYFYLVIVKGVSMKTESIRYPPLLTDAQLYLLFYVLTDMPNITSQPPYHSYSTYLFCTKK